MKFPRSIIIEVELTISNNHDHFFELRMLSSFAEQKLWF